MYKILAINLGSTSSKLAYYENSENKINKNIEHPTEDLLVFDDVLSQYWYRMEKIVEFLKTNDIDYKELDAIVSRGGHTHPIEGGVYEVNAKMLSEIKSGEFGRHACDIGVFIADTLSSQGKALPLIVDPPVTDEFQVLAYYSGLPELPRKSSFHALNQRAVGKNYAKEMKKEYADMNLIVSHMGGGISVATHKKGKMVDANNALTGDGPFSTNRAGTLPAGQLVEMCFSGEYSKAEVMSKINGKGGMMAYLGESNVKIIQDKALSGNMEYKEVLDAMLYQVCKEIGSASTVLKGDVEAILLSGGIAYSEYVVAYIKETVGYLAPIKVYPGEHEMSALASGAFNVLNGTEKMKAFN